ncbi:hypothetical protein ABKV19_023085 [Rosa sericea]
MVEHHRVHIARLVCFGWLFEFVFLFLFVPAISIMGWSQLKFSLLEPIEIGFVPRIPYGDNLWVLLKHQLYCEGARCIYHSVHKNCSTGCSNHMLCGTPSTS